FDFIAMELVRGETIARRGTRLALRDALAYAVQVADALAAAHACGIVHRDLKPGNIMVTDRRLVQGLDFRIAQMATHGGSDSDTETLTMPGNVVGTFAYMSPEQAQGKETDARSDIFSFGCVLYELVTGRRAFDADSQMGTLAAVIGQDPFPLDE